MHSPSEVPAAPTTQHDALPLRVQSTRDDLIDTIGYLGDPNTADDYQWMRTGRFTSLYTKADAETMKQAMSNRATRQTKNYPSPVMLTAIVRISSEDFWLNSCGMWKKPVPAARSFSDVKLSCVCDAPPHPTLINDYDAVIANLRRIISNGATTGTDDNRGVLVQDVFGGERIKLKHKLFDLLRDGEKPDAGMFRMLLLERWIIIFVFQIPLYSLPSPAGRPSTKKHVWP